MLTLLSCIRSKMKLEYSRDRTSKVMRKIMMSGLRASHFTLGAITSHRKNIHPASFTSHDSAFPFYSFHARAPDAPPGYSTAPAGSSFHSSPGWKPPSAESARHSAPSCQPGTHPGGACHPGKRYVLF